MGYSEQMEENDTTVICLTPVKNEAWILEKFLSAASLWATYIVVADQNSTDTSAQICKKFPKVHLIRNDSTTFNEPERQRLLVDYARQLPGKKKLLVALDADEFLSSNFLNSKEWQQILSQPIGTLFYFKWPFIDPSFKTYWAGQAPTMPLALMDDGSPHHGQAIHSPRVPIHDDLKKMVVEDIVVMHFQFVDNKRMESKHRWYKCYEYVNFPKKSRFKIIRRYSHMHRYDKEHQAIPEKWFNFYLEQGIDLKKITICDTYYWDDDVENFIQNYGLNYFKYVGLPGEEESFGTRYLSKTQNYRYTLFFKLLDILVEKFLNLITK